MRKNLMVSLNDIFRISGHSLLRVALFTLIGIASIPTQTQAQEVFNESQGVWRAEVVEILVSTEQAVPGLDTTQTIQTVRAEVIDGPQKGEVVTIENDFLQLKAGQKFYYRYDTYIDGSESYGVIGVDRSGALFVILILFAAALIAFAGWLGVRALVALAGSFAVILYVLLPGILAGWNPLLASIGVAAAVLFGAIFFTHGFNRESVVAYSGTMLTVVLTGIFAWWTVGLTKLTGFTTDESVYLNFNTNGVIDFPLLLLGAIIIGILGVLDDIAVTQAAMVTELYQTDRTQSARQVFTRAMRVGREHVAALVNTLVLAYVGVSLPLLLHVQLTASTPLMIINSEVFATEIVRTVVGSIGLVLCVPIVTALAVWLLRDYTPKEGSVRPHHHH